MHRSNRSVNRPISIGDRCRLREPRRRTLRRAARRLVPRPSPKTLGRKDRARYSSTTSHRRNRMPKKKFINGPAATYALLPQNGESSGHALRWIRTDLNGTFEPFANTERVNEFRPRACDGITIRDESTGVGNSRLVGPAGECTEEPAPLVDYDYDRHLRVMGSDPNAIYFQSTHARKVVTSSDCGIDQKERGVETSTDAELDRELSEIEYKLTDIASNLASDCDPDEYDDFFNSIIGAEITIGQSCEGASRDKPRSLSGTTCLNRNTAADDVSSDAFVNMMKSYDDMMPDYSSYTSVGGSGEVLNALNELQLRTAGRTSCAAEKEVGNPSSSTRIDVKRIDHRGINPYEDAGINLHSKFDCESVLSSYSALDNHPKLLGTTINQRHEQRAPATRVGPAFTIASQSTNFSDIVATPIDPAIQHQDSSWRENIVRKGETREEKKIRKAAVKVGRKEARRHKKSLKEAFKKEEVSQNCILVSNSTPINASISKLS